MTVVTTDLYQAAWLMMNGGSVETVKRLSFVGRNGQRNIVWELVISGMTDHSIVAWQHGLAVGNAIVLRDLRIELKKRLKRGAS